MAWFGRWETALGRVMGESCMACGMCGISGEQFPFLNCTEGCDLAKMSPSDTCVGVCFWWKIIPEEGIALSDSSSLFL